MRVAIDAHAIGTQAGGNETYVRALLTALRDCGEDIEPIALQSPESIVRGEVIANVETVPIPMSDTPLRALWGVSRAAKQAGADLLHAQYYVPPACPLPCVVSVHDVAWRVCPDTLPTTLRLRLRFTIPPTLRRARRVFVLTDSVRAEIDRHYGVNPNKIDVVAPYADSTFRQHENTTAAEDIRRKYGVPDRYFFYCGAMNPRKNLVRLARAVDDLGSAPLVIAGPRVWKSDAVQRQLADMAQRGSIQFIDYVDRNDLPALMRDALVFAYMPIYEGFGLPVLEAMASGAIVLASDIASLREVAGDAAHFADPLDESSIRAALDALISDEALPDRLATAGVKRASAFTPESMAKTAVSGYRAAIDMPHRE